MRKLLYFFIISAGFFSFSCTQDKHHIPGVDIKAVNIDFIEYGKELFAIKSSEVEEGLESLMQSYPAMTNLYLEQIVPCTTNEKIDPIKVKELLKDPLVQHLQDTIGLVIDKFELKEDFTKAFAYAQHYLPNWSLPSIYTLISGFQYQRFIFQDEAGDAIGVGLDFFLGSDYPYKDIDPSNPSFSTYQTRTFNQDHLVKKSMEIWLDDQMPPVQELNLLSQMIRNGKKLYALDKFLPAVHDSIIMEYSQNQWEWVQANEVQIWSFFFSEELFYESNMRKIDKYINPSPDAPGMPPEAPGRIANYIGWQIVEKYMESMPQLGLEELLSSTDAQLILDKSKYKPKRS